MIPEALLREFYYDYMAWKIASYHYKDASPAPSLTKPWMRDGWTQWAEKKEPEVIRAVLNEVERTYKTF